MLQQHPDVFVPWIKEPHFFFSAQERAALARPQQRDLDRGGAGPISDPHQYLRLLPGPAAPSGRRSIHGLHCLTDRGETDPDSLPDAKLVAILRDPVERAHSHYWFDVMWDFAPAVDVRAVAGPEGRRQAVPSAAGIFVMVCITLICRCISSCSRVAYPGVSV